MPTPFKPASSQPVNGDRVIFPSEQPRLNPAAPTGPVIQSHNLNGDETFRPSLNSHVSVDNPLGLHGLHSSGMNISKTGADNEDALVFHTYTGSMDGSLGYGVPGLDYNAAVLSMPFNTATSEDTRGNVLAFYPATNGNLKLDPQVDPSYGNDVHLSPHNVLSNHTTGSTHTIKDEPSTGEPSRRPSHTILSTNSSKIPTGSGSQQKAPPPPINTDTQSHHIASGTKSQHGTWRRGNKGRTPLSVKRSQSTPNVQLAAQLAAASAVSAPPVPSASTTDDISPVTLAYQLDKKRNKLGYHRTSVACGMAIAIPLQF
ncbi:hypothetical protein H072_9469 [Dactylellina haptotyla CBS 200.50]|uniref:Uncharacterized protein n=1 Tax=Dactylellina haptotyla (strain CBS 200.50) TaxID=1284197 RepID=S8A1T9_DACHA|nr:hypothetical protein H072_9469 [Dactylellina haptotyla CBS 200.50]